MPKMSIQALISQLYRMFENIIKATRKPIDQHKFHIWTDWIFELLLTINTRNLVSRFKSAKTREMCELNIKP